MSYHVFTKVNIVAIFFFFLGSAMNSNFAQQVHFVVVFGTNENAAVNDGNTQNVPAFDQKFY